MLSREEVLKIARLARLSLSDKEIEFYQDRLGRILQYVEELEKVGSKDLTGKEVGTVRHVPKDAVAFREDRPVPFDDPHALLKNAPAAEADHFLLPQVLD